MYAMDHFAGTFFDNFVELQIMMMMKDDSERQVFGLKLVLLPSFRIIYNRTVDLLSQMYIQYFNSNFIDNRKTVETKMS